LALLGALELALSVRIVLIGLRYAVGEDGDAAGFEHPHHHGRSRAGKSGNQDD
jgi:hypothetical protein